MSSGSSRDEQPNRCDTDRSSDRAHAEQRMSIGTFGWLVLAFPLAGSLLIALTFRVLPQRLHGVIGTLAIFLAFLSALGLFFKLQSRPEDAKQVVSVGWN